MNTTWATVIQNAEMLYQTRAVRFADAFEPMYRKAFALEGRERILEVGCGPGALTQALKRWYPAARVTGIDLDSAFVRYASERAPDIPFLEGDITALPFENASFDATISNTIQEHIEPSKFFGEQRRVLKPGGVCLVLSSRRRLVSQAPCVKERTDFERELYARTQQYFEEANRKYGVCPYPMSESELPLAMARHGFRNIATSYLSVNLTPDHPDYSPAFAEAIISAARQDELEPIGLYPSVAPGVVSESERKQMAALVNARYDQRLALYRAGEKQWDASVQILMILRGEK